MKRTILRLNKISLFTLVVGLLIILMGVTVLNEVNAAENLVS